MGLLRTARSIVGNRCGAGDTVGGLGDLGGIAPTVVLGGLHRQCAGVGAATGDRAGRAGGALQVGPLRAPGAAGGGPVLSDGGSGVGAGGLGQGGLGDPALGVVAGGLGQLQPVGVGDDAGGKTLDPVVGGGSGARVSVGGVAVDRGAHLGGGDLVGDRGGAVGGPAFIVTVDGVFACGDLDSGREVGTVGVAGEGLGKGDQVQRPELLQLPLAVSRVDRDVAQLAGALGRGVGQDAEFALGVDLVVRVAQGEFAVGGGQLEGGVAEPVILA